MDRNSRGPERGGDAGGVIAWLLRLVGAREISFKISFRFGTLSKKNPETAKPWLDHIIGG